MKHPVFDHETARKRGPLCLSQSTRATQLHARRLRLRNDEILEHLRSRRLLGIILWDCSPNKLRKRGQYQWIDRWCCCERVTNTSSSVTEIAGGRFGTAF